MVLQLFSRLYSDLKLHRNIVMKLMHGKRKEEEKEKRRYAVDFRVFSGIIKIMRFSYQVMKRAKLLIKITGINPILCFRLASLKLWRSGSDAMKISISLRFSMKRNLDFFSSPR